MTEPWGWIVGGATAVAVLTGWAARSRIAGLQAGLVLLGALPFALGGAPAAGPAPWTRGLAELVMPDVWAPLPNGARNLVAEAWSAPGGGAAGVPASAEEREPSKPRSTPDLRAQGERAERPEDPRRLHVGITALCLALLGLVGVRGRAPWIGRGLLVAGLAWAWTGGGAWGPLAAPGELVATAGLAVLAGAALADSRPVRADEPVTGGLFLGAVVVLLGGGLAGWAAWAGSAEARDVTAPLVERLAVPPTPVDVAATAAHVVTSLDRAALAALAAMTALLLHLKGRRWPTAVLVMLVTVAELWAARTGWPGG